MTWRKSRRSTPTPVAPSLRRPLPDGVFPNIAAAYIAHDDTCLSLPDFWLGRHGGVSAFGDQRDCDGCNNTFYNEGLVCTNYNTPDPEADYLYYCGCCATRLGHAVHTTPYGLSLTTPLSESE